MCILCYLLFEKPGPVFMYTEKKTVLYFQFRFFPRKRFVVVYTQLYRGKLRNPNIAKSRWGQDLSLLCQSLQTNEIVKRCRKRHDLFLNHLRGWLPFVIKMELFTRDFPHIREYVGARKNRDWFPALSTVTWTIFSRNLISMISRTISHYQVLQYGKVLFIRLVWGFLQLCY